MIEAIIGIFASSGFGAIIGTIGSYFTRREQRIADKEKAKADYMMSRLEIQADKISNEHELMLADKRIDEIQAQGDIDISEIEASAFKNSVSTGAKSSGIKWLDAAKGLTRIVITVYLLAISSYLAYSISSVIGGIESLNIDEVYSLYKSIIDQVLFLTTLTVSWWFGSRPARSK